MTTTAVIPAAEHTITAAEAKKGYELAVSVWCYICFRVCEGEMSQETFSIINEARSQALEVPGVLVDPDVNDALAARHCYILRLERELKAGAR